MASGEYGCEGRGGGCEYVGEGDNDHGFVVLSLCLFGVGEGGL